MFLKRAFTKAASYITKNSHISFKLKSTISKSRMSSKFIKTSAIVFLLTSTLAKCIDDASQSSPEIHQITKQQLVQFIHKDHSQEFIVIVYDKFKRLNQKQFGQELKPIIEECKNAKIGKVYLIDSKEKDHLNQIIRILKNLPSNNQDEDEYDDKNEKKKTFQCFFKSKFFNEAIQIDRNNGQSISKQIEQIRHFEVNSNNQKINQVLNDFVNNPFLINQTYVVKQCISEGECVESYKREIKKLIDGGMLSGKKEQFKFQLIIDQPTGILSSKSSDYVKNFIKNTEKLKGKSINPNKKEQIYVFKKDLFGNEVSLYSQWLEKEGFNYVSSNDRFLMFIRPRINLISKMNTLPDLLWFLRTAKLNNQVSLSLNNILRFVKQNRKETIQVLKLVHEHFPKINYLIVNSQKVRQLIRHISADYKYVIFKQDSSIIWNKEFLNLDVLESLPSKHDKQQLFVKQFKGKIHSFIDNPSIKSFVQVQKELQINLQKLKNLRDQQLKKISLKKYLIRVCKQHCHRYMDKQILEEINSKLQDPINVYWIDSTAQNIGVEDGDYVLKDGNLQNPQIFIKTN